jgi:predicted DNA-binding transcriptional regulator AlpA
MLRLIKMKELPSIVGIGRTTIYELIAAGEFVPPVQLTPTTCAWRSDLIEKWINERPFVASKKGGISGGK